MNNCLLSRSTVRQYCYRFSCCPLAFTFGCTHSITINSSNFGCKGMALLPMLCFFFVADKDTC